MKLFKKVFILSVVVLSVGSSVAFGCNAGMISDNKTKDGIVQVTDPASPPATTTQSNGAEPIVKPH